MFKNSNSLNLCIFANFFIDNEERLQRMKDSFNSFRDSNPNEWRINIRGRLKQEAGNYLLKELGGRLNLNYIETKKGWFHDSFFFMKDVKSDFIADEINLKLHPYGGYGTFWRQSSAVVFCGDIGC